MVSVDVPEAFIHGELNMTRLVELLLLILIRTTIGPDAARLDTVLVSDPQGIYIKYYSQFSFGNNVFAISACGFNGTMEFIPANVSIPLAIRPI